MEIAETLKIADLKSRPGHFQFLSLSATENSGSVLILVVGVGKSFSFEKIQFYFEIIPGTES